MIFVGIGIGIVVGAIILTMFMKAIWHTYHGDILETIGKIALIMLAIGIIVAGIAYFIL